jgi:hypothetical protein
MLPVLKPKLTQVQQHEFIKGRFSGLGKDSALVGWLVSDLGYYFFMSFLCSFHPISRDSDLLENLIFCHVYVTFSFCSLSNSVVCAKFFFNFLIILIFYTSFSNPFSSNSMVLLQNQIMSL